MLDITAHFDSLYHGYCAWCGYHWFSGEHITFVDDELLCTRCVEDARDYNEAQEFTEKLISA